MTEKMVERNGTDHVECIYVRPERRNAAKSLTHSSESFQDLLPRWAKLLAAFRFSGRNSTKVGELDKETTVKVNTYFIVTRYFSSRTSDRRPYVTLGYKHRGANKPKTKPRVDDEEEEVQVKRRSPYETKKCGCPFKLKGKQIAMSENWQLFVHNGRHNHALVPRKYTTSLPRLKGIGCRGETRYNMPLLEVIEMTLTGKDFTVATAFMRNE
ncbi:hypothetical protein M9H77_13761 [Catharanthus roseus]|uniref:Uncharacterized protein n=1 Tax=Catharanthus roseus TaxID=4058 RepID=A0ACC0BLA9_CATRO|nr:hypothetical protein M9H77_13761 [Catharanthus roseus]